MLSSIYSSVITRPCVSLAIQRQRRCQFCFSDVALGSEWWYFVPRSLQPFIGIRCKMRLLGLVTLHMHKRLTAQVVLLFFFIWRNLRYVLMRPTYTVRLLVMICYWSNICILLDSYWAATAGIPSVKNTNYHYCATLVPQNLKLLLCHRVVRRPSKLLPTREASPVFCTAENYRN